MKTNTLFIHLFRHIRTVCFVVVYGFIFFTPHLVIANTWQWSEKSLVRQVGSGDLPAGLTGEESGYSNYAIFNGTTDTAKKEKGELFYPEGVSISDDGSKIVLYSHSQMDPGLFVSTDGGKTWVDRTYSSGHAPFGLTFGSVSRDGKKLYAILQKYTIINKITYITSSSLMVSVDNGATWSELKFPTSNANEPDPTKLPPPCVVNYTGWRNDPLCQRTLSRLQAAPLHQLTRDGQKLLYISPQLNADRNNIDRPSVWISHDGGNSWAMTLHPTHKQDDYLVMPGLISDPPVYSEDGNVIMLKGTNNNKPHSGSSLLYLSRDGGQSWSQHQFSGSISAMSASGNGNTLLVAASKTTGTFTLGKPEVYKSTDGGTSWSREEIGTLSDYTIIREISADGTIMIAYTDTFGRLGQDITVSYDGGKVWSEVSMSHGYLGGIRSPLRMQMSRNGNMVVIFPSGKMFGSYNWGPNRYHTFYIGKRSASVATPIQNPEGTISISPTDPCVVTTTNPTCKITITWSTKGTKGSVIKATGPLWPSESNVTLSTEKNNGSVDFTLPVGTYKFSIAGYNGTNWIPSLSSVTYTVVAKTNNSATDTPLVSKKIEGSISVSPSDTCTLKAGARTCEVVITWKTKNAQLSVLQGAGPLWPKGANLIDPTSTASGSVNKDLPPGTYLFSVSGFDGKSWSTPLGSVTYKVVESPAPKPQSTVTSQGSSTSQTPASTVQKNAHAPQGYFDSLTCTQISGWALDKDVPEQSVNIQIWDTATTNSGSVSSSLGTYTADKARADVNRALGITGSHGFSIPVPEKLKDGKEHRINVWVIDPVNGARVQLQQSPRTIVCGTPATTPAQTLLASVAASIIAPFNTIADILLDTMSTFGLR